MSNRVITLYIPSEAVDQLDAWADRIDRSRNWLINEAIDVALADEQIIEKYHPNLKTTEKQEVKPTTRKKAGAR